MIQCERCLSVSLPFPDHLELDLIRNKLEASLGLAAARAQQAGDLPSFTVPEVTIERPHSPSHGDYATSLPMKLARAARMSPLQIAQHLTAHLDASDEFASATVAPPGFINFTLADSWLCQQVETILAEGPHFGNLAAGGGIRAQVEFVSVNPTGPVHIGHGRGAVLGSTLANVLSAAGWEVHREYYVNDAGSQIIAFGRSLFVHAAHELGIEAEMPSDGYLGNYMKSLASELLGERKDRGAIVDLAREQPEQVAQEMGDAGVSRMLEAIREDLAALGVTFDSWFSERSLFDTGAYDATLSELRESGYLVDREGATWFTSTALGEDKDNVLVRSNGTPTYFASDIAYHRNKLATRGFDWLIDVWGADHQGHVTRMKAALEALGLSPSKLTVLLSQLVTLKRAGEIVRVSKRTGELVTLREVIDEVGKDAVRFYLLSSSANSHMDFDLELAKAQSQDNPVYYIQYAYARIASIMRLADEKSLSHASGDTSLLTHEAELALIRSMLQLPELVDTIVRTLEPHHLPHYATELAATFHGFYKHCRVISDSDPGRTQARLRLVAAARIALNRTLGMMGMSTPESM